MSNAAREIYSRADKRAFLQEHSLCHSHTNRLGPCTGYNPVQHLRITQDNTCYRQYCSPKLDTSHSISSTAVEGSKCNPEKAHNEIEKKTPILYTLFERNGKREMKSLFNVQGCQSNVHQNAQVFDLPVKMYNWLSIHLKAIAVGGERIKEREGNQSID